MIAVDIPLPKKCIECPMSYWKRSGRFEGMLMCEAMESRWIEENRKGEEYVRDDDADMFFVDEWLETRPAECPIAGEIIYRLK